MDTVDIATWRLLATTQNGPCASLYLPTFPGSPEEFQDRVRLKNMALQAEQELCRRGVPAADGHRLARQILQLADSHAFWHDRSRGMAIFLAQDVFTAWRLPERFPESLYVGRRFQMGKLLPLIVNDLRYATLAFSRDAVRLFQGTRFTFERVVSADLPTNLEETMHYEPVTGARQVHSGAAAQFGKAASVHHGQGGRRDADRHETQAFFREVDAAVVEILRQEHPPLILAATHPNLRLYREITRYGDVAEYAVVGNADHLSPHELHTQSWMVAERIVVDRLHNAVESCGDASGIGKGSSDIRNVLLAAAQGRVKTLLVDRSRALWGKFDVENQTISLHTEMRDGDDDLLDWVAVETYLKQGDVFDVDSSVLPGNSPVAAEFRY